MGVVVGGRVIWNLRYADNTTLVATSKEDLVQMFEELQQASLRFGLKVNASKTHVMAISDDPQTIKMGATSLKRVDQFKYLGSIVNIHSSSSPDIRARLATARRITTELSTVWRSPSIGLELKKRLVKALVWSVALYGAETWALKKQDEDRLHAFELWVWRRVLRIKWTERKTNDWVRHRVGIPVSEGIITQVKRRKMAKYSHWKRRPTSLVIASVEGEVEGRGRPGRRKRAWIDDIERWTDGGLGEARANAWKERRRPAWATATK